MHEPPKTGSYMTDDGRPLSEEQAKARQFAYRAHQGNNCLHLNRELAHALWESISNDADTINEPDANLRRAIQQLRGAGKTDEEVIDLIGKTMAETFPFRLTLERDES